MAQEDVLVFPDAGAGRAASSIDPNLLLALQNNGGFGGGNGAWWWIMFMWMMWDRNGRNGNFNEYLASVNGTEGRQYLADIMNGRFDNLNTLAQMLILLLKELRLVYLVCRMLLLRFLVRLV